MTRRSRGSAARLPASSPPRPSAWRAAPSDSQPPACEAAPPGTGAGTGEWELISDRRGCSPLAAARKRRLGESPIPQQVRRVVGGRLRKGCGQTHSSGESGGASTASSESWRYPVSAEQPASGDALLPDNGPSCGESSEKVPRRFRDGVGGRGGRREGWEGACAGADRYLRPTPPPHSAGSRRGRATRARGRCGPRSCGGRAGSGRLGGGTGRRRGRRPPRRGAG